MLNSEQNPEVYDLEFRLLSSTSSGQGATDDMKTGRTSKYTTSR